MSETITATFGFRHEQRVCWAENPALCYLISQRWWQKQESGALVIKYHLKQPGSAGNGIRPWAYEGELTPLEESLMPEAITVTFRFHMGQAVQWIDEPQWPYHICVQSWQRADNISFPQIEYLIGYNQDGSRQWVLEHQICPWDEIPH